MHCFKFKVFRNNTWTFMHSKSSKKYCNMDNLMGFVSVFILPVTAWTAKTALLTVMSHLTPARWWLWCGINQLCQPSPAPSRAVHAENNGYYFLPAPSQTRLHCGSLGSKCLFLPLSHWYRMRANLKQARKTWEAIPLFHIFPVSFLNSGSSDLYMQFS